MAWQPQPKPSMFTRFIHWFKPAPHQPRLSPAEVERLYPRYRWRVFEAAFMAYAMFYVVRNNFSPVSKEIGDALGYDKSMIGDILAGTATGRPAVTQSPRAQSKANAHPEMEKHKVPGCVGRS